MFLSVTETHEIYVWWILLHDISATVNTVQCLGQGKYTHFLHQLACVTSSRKCALVSPSPSLTPVPPADALVTPSSCRTWMRLEWESHSWSLSQGRGRGSAVPVIFRATDPNWGQRKSEWRRDTCQHQARGAQTSFSCYMAGTSPTVRRADVPVVRRWPFLLKRLIGEHILFSDLHKVIQWYHCLNVNILNVSYSMDSKVPIFQRVLILSGITMVHTDSFSLWHTKP